MKLQPIREHNWPFKQYWISKWNKNDINVEDQPSSTSAEFGSILEDQPCSTSDEFGSIVKDQPCSTSAEFGFIAEDQPCSTSAEFGSIIEDQPCSTSAEFGSIIEDQPCSTSVEFGSIVEDQPCSTSAEFGSIYSSGLLEKDKTEKFTDDRQKLIKIPDIALWSRSAYYDDKNTWYSPLVQVSLLWW